MPLSSSARVSFFLCAAVQGVLAGAVVAAAPPVNVIAASGQPVPDQPGAVFGRGLGIPSINGAGQIAFLAGVAGTGSSTDLLLGTSATDLATIVHGNVPRPDGGGAAPYLQAAAPALNDSGAVAMRYITTASLGQALLYHAPGAATSAFHVVDTVNSAPFILTDRSAFALNDVGVGVFVRPTMPPGAPILRFDPSVGLSTFVATGAPAPDAPGLTLQSFSQPGINNAGSAIFAATLADAANAAAGTAIYTGASADTLRLIARIDDPAPAFPAGSTFTALSASQVTDSGQALVLATVKDPAFPDANRTGVYRYTPGAGLDLIVRSGQTLPAVGDTYRGQVGGGTPVITANGRVVLQDPFRIYTGTNANDMRAIAGTGVAAPAELPAGTSYELFGLQPFVNNVGQVVFLARIIGAPQATDSALFAWDPSAGLHMILREGDSITVGPGDVRTVLPYDVPHNGTFQPGFVIAGYAPEGGMNRALNDNGQLAVLLYLTSPDSSQAYSSAVVTLQAPEPSTAALCLVVTGCALVRRRRRGT
jgi:hypothetical protein